MGVVRNEAFYTTASQVIPTLLIAFAIEANLFLGRPYRVIKRMADERRAAARKPPPDPHSDRIEAMRLAENRTKV